MSDETKHKGNIKNKGKLAFCDCYGTERSGDKQLREGEKSQEILHVTMRLKSVGKGVASLATTERRWLGDWHSWSFVALDMWRPK